MWNISNTISKLIELLSYWRVQLSAITFLLVLTVPLSRPWLLLPGLGGCSFMSPENEVISNICSDAVSCPVDKAKVQKKKRKDDCSTVAQHRRLCVASVPSLAADASVHFAWITPTPPIWTLREKQWCDKVASAGISTRSPLTPRVSSCIRLELHQQGDWRKSL